MTDERIKFRQVLGLSHAISLAITIVIGGGVLVLPGMVYQQTGGSAIYTWLLDMILILPLLFILTRLGRKWPSAGGVAGFLQNAFSRRWGMATEVLFLGTVTLGVPSIALIGGEYLAILLGQQDIARECAIILLSLALIINWYGGMVSGYIQRILAFVLCGILFTVALMALIMGDYTQGTTFAPVFSMQTWQNALPATGMVFYALSGWDTLSFTAEEYNNPRRNFPLAVWISFSIVAVLYLLIAAATQLILSIDDPQIAVTPVASMMTALIGPLGKILISVIAVVIALAHLVSAIWMSSRLIFSSAREGGFLPKVFTFLHPSHQAPRTAIIFCAVIFLSVLCIDIVGLLSMQDMIRIAGQNLFILSALNVIAYLKIAQNIRDYVLGFIALIIVLNMCVVFGWEVFYPLGLIGIGWSISYWSHPLKRTPS